MIYYGNQPFHYIVNHGKIQLPYAIYERACFTTINHIMSYHVISPRYHVIPPRYHGISCTSVVFFMRVHPKICLISYE